MALPYEKHPIECVSFDCRVRIDPVDIPDIFYASILASMNILGGESVLAFFLVGFALATALLSACVARIWDAFADWWTDNSDWRDAN